MNFSLMNNIEIELIDFNAIFKIKVVWSGSEKKSGIIPATSMYSLNVVYCLCTLYRKRCIAFNCKYPFINSLDSAYWSRRGFLPKQRGVRT